MQYPPTFLGFLKAIFDTARGKKLRPRIPKDEPARDIEDYEIYEPDKDPGMEFWQKKAEELAERKEQEKFEAEERMIEDYEFRHKDDMENEQASEEQDVSNEPNGSKEVSEEQNSETNETGTDDFSSDSDADRDEDFESGDFDADFDSDSGSYDSQDY